MNNYLDIINLEHYELKYHPRMSNEKRAAQFAPFAALVGYEDEINEVSRITKSEKILTEEEQERINEQMVYLSKNKCPILLTYFENDKSKDGGEYKKIETTIKKIDSISKKITLIDGKIIFMRNIININVINNGLK